MNVFNILGAKKRASATLEGGSQNAPAVLAGLVPARTETGLHVSALGNMNPFAALPTNDGEASLKRVNWVSAADRTLANRIMGPKNKHEEWRKNWQKGKKKL